MSLYTVLNLACVDVNAISGAHAECQTSHNAGFGQLDKYSVVLHMKTEPHTVVVNTDVTFDQAKEIVKAVFDFLTKENFLFNMCTAINSAAKKQARLERGFFMAKAEAGVDVPSASGVSAGLQY